MSICGRELNPMIEHRTQFTFKGKRDIAKVNMPNIAYPNSILTLKYQMVQKIMNYTKCRQNYV